MRMPRVVYARLERAMGNEATCRESASELILVRMNLHDRDLIADGEIRPVSVHGQVVRTDIAI